MTDRTPAQSDDTPAIVGQIEAIIKASDRGELTVGHAAQDILDLFAAGRSRLLDAIEALPVMKDDRDYSHDSADERSLQILVATSNACNELRAELRAALKGLREGNDAYVRKVRGEAGHEIQD